MASGASPSTTRTPGSPTAGRTRTLRLPPEPRPGRRPTPPPTRQTWLGLLHGLRSEGLPLVGYTWSHLFSLLDWAYREGDRPAEDHLWHMGMYDLEPDGRGGFRRIETPVVRPFRTATERISER
jgi:hypothetical protein